MSQNSVTLSAGGESVTMNEGDFASLAGFESAQALYESIVSLRKQLSLARKRRADALKNIPRWTTIKAESKTMGKEKKGIELTFDQEQPDYKGAIENVDDMLFSKETQLGALALSAYKAGNPLQLVRTTKNGKQKKIEIRYKVEYRQLSLFA